MIYPLRSLYTITYCATVSKIALKAYGVYGIPSPSKNLDIDSTQCNLNACNIADVPSITTKIQTVKTNHIPNIKKIKIEPPNPVKLKLDPSVIDHKTDDNCACANDNAHKRKYDAVCETQFKQNSIV